MEEAIAKLEAYANLNDDWYLKLIIKEIINATNTQNINQKNNNIRHGTALHYRQEGTRKGVHRTSVQTTNMVGNNKNIL